MMLCIPTVHDADSADVILRYMTADVICRYVILCMYFVRGHVWNNSMQSPMGGPPYGARADSELVQLKHCLINFKNRTVLK